MDIAYITLHVRIICTILFKNRLTANLLCFRARLHSQGNVATLSSRRCDYDRVVAGRSHCIYAKDADNDTSQLYGRTWHNIAYNCKPGRAPDRDGITRSWELLPSLARSTLLRR